MTFEQGISDGLAAAMKRLQADLRTELKAQGHYLTGKLHDSIQYKIETLPGLVRAEMECEDYGLAMEFGVPAERIPYSPGSGAGSSKYIQGLIRYWNKRGVTGREGVSAAFATARKHKKEGMPTRASAAFSTTGKRTGFATTVIERDLDLIGRVLEEKTGASLELVIVPELGKIEPLKIFV